MPAPLLRAEIAWTSNFSSPEGSRNWYDITPDVRGLAGVEIDNYGRADEQGQATPTTVQVTLENLDGRYTPELVTGTNYPNVLPDRPIRFSTRYSDQGSGNFLSPSQASFETGVTDWIAGGSVPPALSSSTTHVDDGTHSMLITWGAGGVLPQAQTTIDDRQVAGGLVVGRKYTAQARVWVPAGSPDVGLVIAGIAFGVTTSTKNGFVTISVTFTATSPRGHALQLWPASAPAAGQQCWIDSVMVDEGALVGTFTTTPPYGAAASPGSIRLLAYVDEWPVDWPDDHSLYAVSEISASSRRSRLGDSAALPSAIRGRYLADSPETYWPMDEDTDAIDRAGRQAFRDITNPILYGRSETEVIGAWSATPALAPVVRDGTQGPTDEESLVLLGATSDLANPDWQHYVGASLCTIIGTNLAVGCTYEMVARVIPTNRDAVGVDLARVFSGANSYSDEFRFGLFSTGTDRGVYLELVRRGLDGVTIEDTGSTWAYWTTHEDNQAAFDRATDGEIHHYMIEVLSNLAVLFFDGVGVAYAGLSNSFSQPFRSVAMGSRTLFATTWIGHAATYDTIPGAGSFTGTEAQHAEAATTASETLPARVTRLATFLAVPAAELDVEASWAADLGVEPEKGRAGIDVLDEIAQTTGGVLYDKRPGHLAMQARNHRYNQASAFTLSVSAEEIDPGLRPLLDKRYLVNSIDVQRVGSSNPPLNLKDQASIDAHGLRTPSTNPAQIVSDADTEAEAYGSMVLARYSKPRVRFSQVTVDLGDLTPAQRAKVLAADIGTRFTLNVTGIGQSPAATLTLFIEGAGPELITPQGHSITFNTTPGDMDSPIFVPDDPTFGVLDAGNLIAF